MRHIIESDNCQYFGGLGDVTLLSWLPVTIRTECPVKQELCKLLSVPTISHDPQAIDLSDVYRKELEDGGRRRRIDYVREFLGIETEPQRPRFTGTHKSNNGFNVLLFPQTHWQPREWPASYWVDLSWKLQKLGYRPLVVLEKPDRRYANVAVRCHGYSITEVAALVDAASLVVGNDSFAAHLAGTLNRLTLAICGPTRLECVFSHLDSVATIQSGMACVGCHFKAPNFRAACDQGCQALFGLSVDEVLGVCVEMLAGAGVTPEIETMMPVDSLTFGTEPVASEL